MNFLYYFLHLLLIGWILQSQYLSLFGEIVHFILQAFWKKLGDMGLLGMTAPGSYQPNHSAHIYIYIMIFNYSH